MRAIQFTKSNGKKADNQFIIYDDKNNIEVFQSYENIIATKEGDKIILDSNLWDVSKTTAKYRDCFLNESRATTLRKIKSGEYLLKDLN